MNDHSSPLSQRVRRLLGTGALPAEPPEPLAPPARRPHDTGALFESQIGRLSSALRDLQTIDRQREAELRALRERLAIAEALHRRDLAQRLGPAVRRLDALIAEAAHLLQPAPPPAAATLFERMRAQAALAGAEPARREALLAWASALVDLRAQLAELADERAAP